jgi:hypothetical protein
MISLLIKEKYISNSETSLSYLLFFLFYFKFDRILDEHAMDLWFEDGEIL